MPFTLRPSTPHDLPSAATLQSLSFLAEPEQNYRFPLRHQFEQDYLYWTRREYENYLLQPSKYVVHVVESDERRDVESGDGIGKKIVALAVWDISPNTRAIHTDIGVDTRPDANIPHCEAFASASRRRSERYFHQYGEKRIHLEILMVHPEFRRKGLGAMLVNWGINYAVEKGLPAVTLCASPMGRMLYATLGFEYIATEIVQVDGEDEKCESAIMVRQIDET